MSPSKLTPRSGLTIPFKTASFRFGSKRDGGFDLPRPLVHRVRALPAIVFAQSRSEIARYSGVMRSIVRRADDYVNVVEVVDRSHWRCTVMMAEEGWPAKP
jgi:hypothetical protein